MEAYFRKRDVRIGERQRQEKQEARRNRRLTFFIAFIPWVNQVLKSYETIVVRSEFEPRKSYETIVV